MTVEQKYEIFRDRIEPESEVETDRGLRPGIDNIITRQMTEREKVGRGLDLLQYGDKRNNPEALDQLLTDEDRNDIEDLDSQQQ